MKKVIGIATLLSVFSGIFAAMAAVAGFLVTAGIFAVALGLTALIIFSFLLIVDD